MLRRRLFLNLLPFVVMLLATGIYALVLFSRLSRSVDSAGAKHYRNVVAAQQMLAALGEIDRDAWSSAGAAGGSDPKLAAHRQRFETNLVVQMSEPSLPADRALNQQLAANYGALTGALTSLADVAGPDRKHALYEQELTPRLLATRSALEKILDLNQRAILDTGQNVVQITRKVQRLMIAGLVIALGISAYLSYQLSRSVLRPIQFVTEATRKLAEGNLEPTVPVLSRDELGQLAVAFNRLAAQLREYRQSTTDELVRLHRTMESTLGSFPDPIFVLNKEGAVELCNPAAAEFAAGLGLDGQLPGRLHAIAHNTLASGEHFLPHSFDAVVCYRPNGVEKFFLPRILTMRDKENALFGVAVVLYDVTRFRLLDAAKSDLVATVSHELKSPLTSIRMALHLLLERTVGALTPKQDELVQTARNDTERLLRILNDLLDLARLEGGNAQLHRETVTPADLLQALVAESTDAAAAKGLKLTCAVDAGLPAVFVDRQRIGHVFSNLVSNAVKYSPPGAQLVLRAGRAEDGAVQFSVADEGPGVPEEYQTRIFERFFRVPGQRRQGAGLGLSIAREITLAHGGRIGVRSSPGHGAMFFVRLEPAKPAE